MSKFERLKRYVESYMAKSDPILTLKTQAELLCHIDVTINGRPLNEPYNLVSNGKLYKAFTLEYKDMTVLLIMECQTEEIFVETVLL